MKLIYISHSISTTKKNQIQEILRRKDPNILFVPDDSQENDLRVISSAEFSKPSVTKVFTLTEICALSMENVDFNPFTYHKCKKLKNIFLLNKTVAFDKFLDSSKRSKLSRLVIQMGGQITDFAKPADIYIGDPKLTIQGPKKIIDYHYLENLDVATKNLDINNYLIGKASQKTESTKSSQFNQLSSIVFQPQNKIKPGIGKLLLTAQDSQGNVISGGSSSPLATSGSQHKYVNLNIHNDLPRPSIRKRIEPREVKEYVIEEKRDTPGKLVSVAEPIMPSPVRESYQLSQSTLTNRKKAKEILSRLYVPSPVVRKAETGPIDSESIVQFSQIPATNEQQNENDELSYENDEFGISQSTQITPSQDPLMQAFM